MRRGGLGIGMLLGRDEGSGITVHGLFLMGGHTFFFSLAFFLVLCPELGLGRGLGKRVSYLFSNLFQQHPLSMIISFSFSFSFLVFGPPLL